MKEDGVPRGSPTVQIRLRQLRRFRINKQRLFIPYEEAS